ncbi:hypothetical protein K438DRAFT_2024806 [Mycena galopus ATCC 62051]|nr:hypothetical protein K438DRAFT_2024806 [Mycena galopus ATCC 62051]
MNKRTSAAESGHVPAPPGHFSHDHALRYAIDPLIDCDAAFLLRYYAVYKNWHRIPLALPVPWSCDWRRWDDGPYFSGSEGLVGLEGRVTQAYGVSTPVQPMAFFASGPGCETICVFFASGDSKYYFYNMGCVMRFEEHFTSHEDFLRRFEMYLDSGTDMWYVRHQKQM